MQEGSLVILRGPQRPFLGAERVWLGELGSQIEPLWVKSVWLLERFCPRKRGKSLPWPHSSEHCLQVLTLPQEQRDGKMEEVGERECGGHFYRFSLPNAF